MSINTQQAQIIQLPKIEDPRGNLTFIQNQFDFPFEIKRVYWIYDVPGGKNRGSHAFRTSDELIIAMSGAFEVEVSKKGKSELFHLNRSYFGLYIPKMTWRSIHNFSSNSMALVLSSTEYSESDYIRDRSEYKELTDEV